MRDCRFSAIDRRGFMRLGVVSALAVAAGCDSNSGEVQQATNAPTTTGARKKLDGMMDKAATSGKKTPPKK